MAMQASKLASLFRKGFSIEKRPPSGGLFFVLLEIKIGAVLAKE